MGSVDALGDTPSALRRACHHAATSLRTRDGNEDEGNGGGGTTANEYKRYTVRLAPRSVADGVWRDKVSRLLLALSDGLDVGGADVQLAEIDVTFTAAAGSLADVKSKANDSGASWSEEDEDF